MLGRGMFVVKAEGKIFNKTNFVNEIVVVTICYINRCPGRTTILIDYTMKVNAKANTTFLFVSNFQICDVHVQIVRNSFQIARNKVISLLIFSLTLDGLVII